ncbi:hypothetical protein BJX96DRAFT_142308 [Aspergillus floccosus]
MSEHKARQFQATENIHTGRSLPAYLAFVRLNECTRDVPTRYYELPYLPRDENNRIISSKNSELTTTTLQDPTMTATAPSQVTTLCREFHCAKNTPVGNTDPPTTRSDAAKFTLMPRSQPMPVKTIKIWEDLLPDSRGDGIAGLSVTWTEDDEQRAGRCDGPASKQFHFGQRERIQIMYIYADDRVDGLWFVTDAQKSFFPGKSSTRYEMENLGDGMLVGFEGTLAGDENGFLSLGATFRQPPWH